MPSDRVDPLIDSDGERISLGIKLDDIGARLDDIARKLNHDGLRTLVDELEAIAWELQRERTDDAE